MKNTMKRVLSGVFCLMLLLSLCGTAFAAETETAQTGTLTISGEAKDINRTVNAYQLFSIKTETANGETTYIYTLNSKYAGFFNGKIEGFEGMTEAQKSNAAYQYVLSRKTGDNADKNVQDFADAFITWIDGQATPITPEKTAEMAGVKAEGAAEADPFISSTATIADVAYGYYLVFVGNAPASLVNVTEAANTVKLKAEYPTVDKKVDGEEATSAEIGKKVTYTLTSKVPDMAGYTSYVFNFKDTLSKGLTFNDDVKVTIDGEVLSLGTDYTVTYTQADNSFVVAMQNMIARKAQTGKEIVVTYSATVNENAEVSNKANTNEAKVEYSNDPSTSSTGKSTPEVVEVYTFDIDINKVAHGTKAPLADATFELRASNNKNDPVIQLVQLADNSHYRVAKEGETGTVPSVTTGADGTIKIKGLKEGTYYLFETAAPANYNPLTDPVKVEITAEYNADGTLSAWYVNKTATSESGDKVVEIENRAGAVLPGTGGIGTAIFAILGVGLVIGGTQMMGRKKKNEEI